GDEGERVYQHLQPACSDPCDRDCPCGVRSREPAAHRDQQRGEVHRNHESTDRRRHRRNRGPRIRRRREQAIQGGFQRYAECNAGTAESEFQVTSPIIGTVNLDGALDIDGAALGNTNVVDKEGNVIPQRTNVMITSAFELPGFEARLRAFRVYKPVADSSKTSGYKFSQDGTRLWIACAPGTTSSGACASLSTSARNIYTSLPDGTMVTFDSSNATTLAPYL